MRKALTEFVTETAQHLQEQLDQIEHGRVSTITAAQTEHDNTVFEARKKLEGVVRTADSNAAEQRRQLLRDAMLQTPAVAG